MLTKKNFFFFTDKKFVDRMSTSMLPLSRNHHSSRRFNNARSKSSNHHSNLNNNAATSNTSNVTSDLNNNNNNSTVLAHYEHGHADSLLEMLNELRLNKQLCDVTLIVDQHQYLCHKVTFRSSFQKRLILVLFACRRMFSLLPVLIFGRCSPRLKCVKKLNLQSI